MSLESMNLVRVLNEQYSLLRPSEHEQAGLKRECVEFLTSLREALAKMKLGGRVFVGGSFAKGTLVKKGAYDIDVFIRLKNIKETHATLEKALAIVAASKQLALKKIHGSRDYFQLFRHEGRVIFEVIPVLDIPRPSHAENVTDLSYFHVPYIKKRLNLRMADDVRLAKQFCHAHGIYGAESYIRGFSGYGLECLIIQYKTFTNLLRRLSRAEEPIVLDPARHYRTAIEARLSLNESKRQSPIVLVDPTYKERNVLAALSEESFQTFRKAAKKFLARPSPRFFEEKRFDAQAFFDTAKKRGLDVVKIVLMTDRQAGDIAGTKLKKSALFIESRLGTWFELKEKNFVYDGKQGASLYVSFKPFGETIRKGPPSGMKQAAAEFKKVHRRTFVRGGRIYAKIKMDTTPQRVLEELMTQREQMHSMGITDARVEKV